MKKLIAIASFAVLINSISAQTKLDSLIFDKVNQYRAEHNIHPLIWDKIALTAAQHHSEYMCLSGYLEHGEDSIADFKSINKLTDRFDYAGIPKEYKYTVMENAEHLIVLQSTHDTMSIDFLANSIVASWKGSASHNTVLLDSIIYFGAVNALPGYTYKYIVETDTYELLEFTGDNMANHMPYIVYSITLEAYTKPID